MSIRPNIQIYQNKIGNSSNQSVTSLPDIPNIDLIDSEPIDIIRSQPLPNDISIFSSSAFKLEIENMVKLLGSYCKENSIDQIKQIVTLIHNELNGKGKHIIKSWTRKLTSLHPKVDDYIKNNLGFFKTPYSEIIGTNTIMYYADTSNIDIYFWAKAPLFKDNQVIWFDNPWESPTYLRESIREKLPTKVVEHIMNSSHITTKYMRRNLTYEALRTTANGTGGEEQQVRPIDFNIAHGVSLNNDHYHQEKRIFNNTNKVFGKIDAITKLDETGCLVHLLVNYLEPLMVFENAAEKSVQMSSPIGIEETFPRHTSDGKINTSNAGQPVYPMETKVNDDSLKPEEI